MKIPDKSTSYTSVCKDMQKVFFFFLLIAHLVKALKNIVYVVVKLILYCS